LREKAKNADVMHLEFSENSQSRKESTYNIDEAVRSLGYAAAVKITAANSYIRAFHVESRWFRYKVYATLRVKALLSECISAGIFPIKALALWLASRNSG
jgi:hypothetical protein